MSFFQARNRFAAANNENTPFRAATKQVSAQALKSAFKDLTNGNSNSNIKVQKADIKDELNFKVFMDSTKNNKEPTEKDFEDLIQDCHIPKKSDMFPDYAHAKNLAKQLEDNLFSFNPFNYDEFDFDPFKEDEYPPINTSIGDVFELPPLSPPHYMQENSVFSLDEFELDSISCDELGEIPQIMPLDLMDEPDFD